MDIQKLTSTLLSADAVKGLSQRSGASTGEVKKVLSQALPALLGGVEAQAKGADTAAGFAAALSDHAKSNTSDLSGFWGNVDLADGAKIIGHLLGGSSDQTTKSVAKKAGVSKTKTTSILTAAAPLLMSLLGQQADEEDKGSVIGDLIGTLLSNVDVGELLTGLLTDDSGTKKKSASKKSASKKASGSKLGEVIGSILKSFLK